MDIGMVKHNRTPGTSLAQLIQQYTIDYTFTLSFCRREPDGENFTVAVRQAVQCTRPTSRQRATDQTESVIGRVGIAE